MAAVTIEDCLKIVPNRFELALIASYRAEQLMNGSPMLYKPKKQEKNTVIALREIGMGLLDVNEIRKEMREKLKTQSLFNNVRENTEEESDKEDDGDDILSNISLDEDDDIENIDEDNNEEDYDNFSSEDLGDDLDQ